MKIKKKKMRPLLYSTAFAVALSFYTPTFVGATENQETTTNESQEKIEVKTAEQAVEIPVTEIEIKENKEKKQEGLSIGQQPNAEGVNNYVVTHSSTGSKSDIDSKYLPQTITVIGQKVLKEQHADTVEKALSNVAGVSVGTGSWSANSTNLNPSFNIRGFPSNKFYVDGLYDNSSVVGGWTGNMDRIEVLKGPSSVLYGNNSPGGVINYVTKKPLTKESITIGQEFGSYGTWSTDIDMSIPLTKDKKWLSRTIINTDNQGSFYIGDVRSRHFNGSVIVQGKPKADTVYTFLATYNNYNLPGQYSGSLPWEGTIKPPYGVIPYNVNYYSPNARYYYIGRSISGQVEHKFNNIWSITSSLRYSNSRNDRTMLGDETWVNKYDTIGSAYNRYIFNNDTLSWDTTGNAKFKAWGLDHNLVLGYEWSRYNSDWPLSVLGDVDPVSATNPIWGEPYNLRYINSAASHIYRYGSYLSDTVTVSDKLKVTGGISHTAYSDEKNQNAAGNTWRLGATYETSPGVTWFAGYSTAYEYQSAQSVKVGGKNVTVNGTALKQYFSPKTGDQLEGGVKYNVSNKASVTLALYNIHMKNIANNAGTNRDTDWQLVGEQASKGFEIDANYVIQPGWNLLAAYSHDEATTVADRVHPTWIGKQFSPVPTQTFKLWSTYEIQDGPRKGLGFGGGVTYVGKRPLDNADSAWTGSYSTIDAVVYYKTKGWNYSLNLYNLTNKQYWPVLTGSTVYAGTPRSFTLRIERTF
ncbi:Ferrichrome outer membrane transporter/phage receptor [Sporomusa silvacetica DSM 10669]|uniref:Ferrichrome outer membrane transporter/phage receptor n=1 Tax=Sporomusa silvacetica DSM 10669 TaxID=1123289 RepID=A0ABZ3IH75_9FIRM|nr:TonB-dependent receptor [Sporomusa silvacetica]OZC14857.1 ferrichrome-iron receptor precursor [Sporomusa silvacetica DSM 10669]